MYTFIFTFPIFRTATRFLYPFTPELDRGWVKGLNIYLLIVILTFLETMNKCLWMDCWGTTEMIAALVSDSRHPPSIPLLNHISKQKWSPSQKTTWDWLPGVCGIGNLIGCYNLPQQTTSNWLTDKQGKPNYNSTFCPTSNLSLCRQQGWGHARSPCSTTIAIPKDQNTPHNTPISSLPSSQSSASSSSSSYRYWGLICSSENKRQHFFQYLSFVFKRKLSITFYVGLTIPWIHPVSHISPHLPFNSRFMPANTQAIAAPPIVSS